MNELLRDVEAVGLPPAADEFYFDETPYPLDDLKEIENPVPEAEVLILIAGGLRDKDMLELSETGQTYLTYKIADLMAELDAASRPHAIARAVQAGRLPLPRLNEELRPNLSDREQTCLAQRADGHDLPAIAASLGISDGTVKGYLKTARQKLAARTTEQAVWHAYGYGIFSTDRYVPGVSESNPAN